MIRLPLGYVRIKSHPNVASFLHESPDGTLATLPCSTSCKTAGAVNILVVEPHTFPQHNSKRHPSKWKKTLEDKNPYKVGPNFWGVWIMISFRPWEVMLLIFQSEMLVVNLHWIYAKLIGMSACGSIWRGRVDGSEDAGKRCKLLYLVRCIWSLLEQTRHTPKASICIE